jgi:hypothetical protein
VSSSRQSTVKNRKRASLSARSPASRSDGDLISRQADVAERHVPQRPAVVPMSHDTPHSRLFALPGGLHLIRVDAPSGTELDSPNPPSALIQLSAPPVVGGAGNMVTFKAYGDGASWLPPHGGAVVAKVGGLRGVILLTAYGMPQEQFGDLQITVERLAELQSQPLSECQGEVPLEIAVDIERLGLRSFRGGQWVGSRDARLPIRALAARVIGPVPPLNIEIKGFGPDGSEANWRGLDDVSGAQGPGFALMGLAIRVSDCRYQAVYRGLFRSGGITGPCRNGQLCGSPIADDPLVSLQLSVRQQYVSEPAQPADANRPAGRPEERATGGAG